VIWIGTDGGGLLKLERGKIKIFKNNPLRNFTLVNNKITELYTDNEGILWVGTIAGISNYAPRLHKFSLLQYFDFQGKNYNNNVYCTYEDKEGAIWLGTQSSGLVKLNASNQIDQVYPRKEPKIDETWFVRSIFEDSKGNFWLGCPKDVMSSAVSTRVQTVLFG